MMRFLNSSLLLLIVLLVAGCGKEEESQKSKDRKRVEEIISNLSRYQPTDLDVKDHSAKTELKILVMGDFGLGTIGQQEVSQAMSDTCGARGGCDFLISVGDNIYSHGVSSTRDPLFQTRFEDVYQQFGRFDFWMIMGNHDWLGNVQAAISYSALSERWRQPHLHYEIPYLPSWVRIYGVDIEDIVHHARHVEETMCGYGGWKIVFDHHAIYSHGYHGANPRIVNGLKPKLLKCDVDVLLSGHDHVLELLRVDSKLLQVVSGAAGEARELATTKNPIGVETVFSQGAKLGFTLLTLTENSFEIEYLDKNGSTLFSHTLSKR
ncbi:MAG: metallophosphoesterase [Bdellovibrionales bacterium]|nr:metallophosphoesterase [Bdellovibrionales bacterium]